MTISRDKLKPYAHGIDEIEASSSRCMAEYQIIGGSSTRVDKPWIPYALLAGTSTSEEINRKRGEEAGTWTNTSVFFGLPSRLSVMFSFEPVNPETGETVRDPQILQVMSSQGELVPEEIWKGKKYVGPYARNL